LLDEMDLQALGATAPSPFAERLPFYEYLARKVIGDQPITFLEFGVFEGESIEQWATLNAHPECRFIGFDSFEGLPEDWRSDRPKGMFSVNGNAPQIADPRVSFVKGWFAQTIPAFISQFGSQHQLVLHLDADLYSSTMLALVYLSPWIRPGTLLVFDEFCDRNHEFKAFRDWQAITKHAYRVIARAQGLMQVCIEIQSGEQPTSNGTRVLAS